MIFKELSNYIIIFNSIIAFYDNIVDAYFLIIIYEPNA
jgi:hypothetical protein